MESTLCGSLSYEVDKTVLRAAITSIVKRNTMDLNISSLRQALNVKVCSRTVEELF